MPRTSFRFRHFPQLDGLRGLAVLLVVFGHWIQFGGFPPAISMRGAYIDQFGVMLFFALSGFLITGLLQQERARTGRIDLKAFYMRRALRLFPAFGFYLFVCYLLARKGAIDDAPASEFLICIFYCRNFLGRSGAFGHLWSLSMEEQYYSIWPWITKFVPRNRLLFHALFGVVLISAARGIAIIAHPSLYNSGIFWILPGYRLDSILIGCCIVLAAADPTPIVQKLIGYVSRIPAAPLLFVVILWVCFAEPWCRPLYIAGQMVFAALIVCQLVLSSNQILLNFFSRPWLRYCGKISYSLYLWQHIFLVVHKPDWGIIRQFPLSVILPFVCALISYYLIEIPGLRLKKRFEPSNPAAKAGIISASATIVPA